MASYQIISLPSRLTTLSRQTYMDMGLPEEALQPNRAYVVEVGGDGKIRRYAQNPLGLNGGKANRSLIEQLNSGEKSFQELMDGSAEGYSGDGLGGVDESNASDPTAPPETGDSTPTEPSPTAQGLAPGTGTINGRPIGDGTSTGQPTPAEMAAGASTGNVGVTTAGSLGGVSGGGGGGSATGAFPGQQSLASQLSNALSGLSGGGSTVSRNTLQGTTTPTAGTIQNLNNQGATAQINQGAANAQTTVTDFLDQITNQLSDSFGEAASQFDQYRETTRGATEAQADLVGLNGPEAQAAALQAVESDPAFQFQRQQGQRALEANAAQRGLLASGNFAEEAQQFGQGLASQFIQRRFDNLGSIANRDFQALQGSAGTRAGLGQALAGSMQSAGDSLANIELARANALATLIAGGQGQFGGLQGIPAGSRLSGFTPEQQQQITGQFGNIFTFV